MNRIATALLVLASMAGGPVALAQDQPPANTGMPPVNSVPERTPAPPAPADNPDSGAAPAAAQEQQLHNCMNAEKARNPGLPADQVKHRCTLKIGPPSGG